MACGSAVPSMRHESQEYHTTNLLFLAFCQHLAEEREENFAVLTEIPLDNRNHMLLNRNSKGPSFQKMVHRNDTRPWRRQAMKREGSSFASILWGRKSTRLLACY